MGAILIRGARAGASRLFLSFLASLDRRCRLVSYLQIYSRGFVRLYERPPRSPTFYWTRASLSARARDDDIAAARAPEGREANPFCSGGPRERAIFRAGEARDRQCRTVARRASKIRARVLHIILDLPIRCSITCFCAFYLIIASCRSM